MIDDREKVLARIREALRHPAPRPGHGGGISLDQAQDSSHHAVPDYTDWLPHVGKSSTERLALFARLAVDLRAEFHLLEDPAGLPDRFRQMTEENQWQRIGTHRAPLTDAILQGTSLPVLQVDGGYGIDELERCDVGVTECEALVAQTGSVLVSSRRSGGRALSVLPPHHVVVARTSQLVGDLSEAYVLLRERYGSDYPSFLSFITGPSRTGDIERILVLGAHGPKRLTIFCVPG